MLKHVSLHAEHAHMLNNPIYLYIPYASFSYFTEESFLYEHIQNIIWFKII